MSNNQTNYCKCLKCKKLFDLYVLNAEEVIKQLSLEGCQSCQSRNLEWKVDFGGAEVNWTTEKYSKCSNNRVVNILNWEKIKNLVNTSKQAFIKKIHEEGEWNCVCQERETKILLKFKNYGSELRN